MTTIQASTLTTPSGSLKAATPANPSITTSMSSPATARTDSSLKKTSQVASVAHEKTSGDRSKGRRKTTAAPATESTPRLRSDTCALLVRKVNALTGMAKEEEIKRLNALPDMEMRWANSDAVILRTDSSLGMRRVEVLCRACHSHLGHVFEGEGYPTPTDQRYCINSICLRLKPAQ